MGEGDLNGKQEKKESLEVIEGCSITAVFNEHQQQPIKDRFRTQTFLGMKKLAQNIKIIILDDPPSFSWSGIFKYDMMIAIAQSILMISKTTQDLILLQNMHLPNKIGCSSFEQSYLNDLKQIDLLQVRMQQQSSAIRQQSACNSYFDLVQKIGSKGRYQKTLVLLFIWALYSGGVGQLGPTFFFIMQPYDCQSSGLLTKSCTKYVCSLPSFEHMQFLSKDFDAFTIPVQYNYHYCDGSEVVNAVFGFVYFGFLVSVFLRAFIVDSFGRRPLMIIFNGIIALGSILSICSINIWVTGVGLFLVNCGSDGAMKFSFNYLTEYYDPKLRQKYSIFIQIFYTVGYMLICISSFLINDWRMVAGIFIVVPAVAGFIFCVLYLREIPRYMVKKGEEYMMTQLNSIAKINKGRMITLQDIRNIAGQKRQGVQQSARVNPLILCRYSSLRKISVCYFIIIFLILTLYYGSSILVDSFNINTHLVGVILATADFTVYIPAFTLINSLKRKTTSLILSITIAGAAMGLIFIEKPQGCQFCFIAIMEIILLFVFRFSVNFLYVVVLIYSNELFPEKVRAASSILQLFGGLSLVINPALLGFLQKSDINPMVYFAISAVVSFGVYGFLPETNGVIKQEIDQLKNRQTLSSNRTSEQSLIND